ncbi:MAG: phosphoesterase [Candidatus Eremiobacteraeota bacterium]|nr:phosphoesterase [Candidatus Eremiobacteraeota bacterium]
MKPNRFAALIAACLLWLPAATDGAKTASADLRMPQYKHVIVIMEENKAYGQVVGSADAPAISRLARAYGTATQFFAETHPSEPNYVALVGGSTFGIRDDDAFYCKPHDVRPACPNAGRAGYPNHTIEGPSLATQLERAGLSWKNYNESLPHAGSLATIATDSHAANVPPDLYVYASKHSGFVNFASVQNDPMRAERLVGFGQLKSDLRSGNVPNFSLVIPNLCNDMHGASAADSPPDCRSGHSLIWRGDREVQTLVDEIMASPIWKSRDNTAIVITFDEDDGDGTQGCCGNNPGDPANAGGGHIATVVVTNHGPRAKQDGTPYSHYALLRTIEDAFGIHSYLRRANAPGVLPMLTLFATTR